MLLEPFRSEPADAPGHRYATEACCTAHAQNAECESLAGNATSLASFVCVAFVGSTPYHGQPRTSVLRDNKSKLTDPHSTPLQNARSENSGTLLRSERFGQLRVSRALCT